MKLSTSTISFLLSAALVGSLAACGGGGGSDSSGGSTTTPPSYGGGLTPGSVTLTASHHVKLTTNYGTMVIGVDSAHAPLSAADFLTYVSSGFYNNTLFHRVVPGFVVQGGGYANVGGAYQLKTNTNAAVGLESRNGLSNLQYTIGLARASDPNSATSQFYINLVNNASQLDYPQPDGAGYAVFGAISATDTTSIATLNAIAAVAFGTNAQTGAANWPTSDVVVSSAVQTD